MIMQSRRWSRSFLFALVIPCAACRPAQPTCGTCVIYKDNCSATQDTWQTVPAPDSHNMQRAIAQQMMAAGCSAPIEYEPCSSGKCGTLVTSPWPVSMCPTAFAQSISKYVRVIDPVNGGCDCCTGAPPQGWSLVTWPPDFAQVQPSGCHDAFCGQ